MQQPEVERWVEVGVGKIAGDGAEPEHVAGPHEVLPLPGRDPALVQTAVLGAHVVALVGARGQVRDGLVVAHLLVVLLHRDGHDLERGGYQEGDQQDDQGDVATGAHARRV